MAEPTSAEVEDGKFQHYTPQHPLPDEIRKMTRDDTVCQYCGVSYLIHNEIKVLEDKLKATEKELEHYKGREDRERRLKAEKEELQTNNKALQEQLTSKENVLSMLKQELKMSTDSVTSLQSQLKSATDNAEKYRHQYLTVLRKFSQLSTIVRQQKETLAELKKNCENSRQSAIQHIATARERFTEMVGNISKGYEGLQSRLQCVEMEHMVTTQANKSLAEKLKAQEQRANNLQQCEQEMRALESKNSQLLTRQKELENELEKAVSESRQLTLQTDQFKQQLKTKVEELDRLLKDKQIQAQKHDNMLKQLDKEVRQKEGELASVLKQLKDLENKHREVECRQADIAQQNVLSANEAKGLKESLERARADAEALKNEREGMIAAHQNRIEELRESFKRKMADAERFPEKLQAALVEEKRKHQAEMTALEDTLKQSFVMELKIEKEKYDELLQKYQSQNNDRSSQKASEIAELESRHQRALQAVQQQMKDAKKNAEQREADLKSEIDSLKRIINDLQNKLSKFESQGQEKAGELTVQVNNLRSQLKVSEEQLAALRKDLQQAQEEVQFLQDTVRSECEERFELTESLGEARRELLALKKPNGGYPSSGGSSRAPTRLSNNGLAPLRPSASVGSLQSSSAHSEDGKPRPPVPTNAVNVSYKGEASRTPRQKHTDTVADTRRRISALLGRPS